MKKGLYLALCLWGLAPLWTNAQTLNGRVLLESGERGISIQVRAVRSNQRVLTDQQGTFHIPLSQLPDTLYFSGAGLEPYSVAVTNKMLARPSFEVVMLQSRKTLEEVVVTGFAASRRKEMTYTSSKISADEMVMAPAAGIAGERVSGLVVPPSSRSKTPTPAANNETPTGKFYRYDSIPATPSSKLLTAGEINDFNKWKMWGDFTASEFKEHQERWKLYTNNRFSVQLQNAARQPAINEAVFLINRKTNDTTWRSLTDNTGKAELWAGLFHGNAGEASDYYIVDGYGHTIEQPSVFQNGVNLLETGRPCELGKDIDISFVVDATGSMGDEIDFLKLELEDVLRATMKNYSSLSLRASAVFYRDKRDEYLVRRSAFDEDLLQTINFIKLQKANGGGDFPEAVDDALDVALDSLDWNPRARARILFLVLDAPPHDQALEKIQRQIRKAAALGIRIIPVACSGTDKTTEFLLRAMALATNGTYAFLTDDSGIGNAHIKPTTDKYAIEILNDLLQRLISQCVYAKECTTGVPAVDVPVIRQPGIPKGIKIYPNPTDGRFTIESRQPIRELYITDFTGKLIMRVQDGTKKGRWQVDIHQYPSGTYLVKYVLDDGNWGALKVVLVH